MIINGNNVSMSEISNQQLSSWLQECRDAFPVGKNYEVLYADPPWTYSTNSAKNISNNCTAHYPTLSIDELKALPVKSIASKNAALFLWTSNPILPKAIDLMEAWGFEYKTVFKVWRKQNRDGSPVCVPGWWSRSSTELLLVGARGSPLANKTILNEPQEFSSQRESHSEKPDEIRDAIFNFLDVSKRIELFSRKVCDDWDSWGLETPGYFYEGSGESAPSFKTVNEKVFRSFGCQVDTLLNLNGKVKKIHSERGKAITRQPRTKPHIHREDCQCCVCKVKRKNLSGAGHETLC